jgi:hypothetical protein
MAVKDIPDELVVLAFEAVQNHPELGLSPVGFLMKWTDEHYKVCCRALNRAAAAKLLWFSSTIHSAALTDTGRALLEATKSKAHIRIQNILDYLTKSSFKGYDVVCDASNNTPETIAKGLIVADVTLHNPTPEQAELIKKLKGDRVIHATVAPALDAWLTETSQSQHGYIKIPMPEQDAASKGLDDEWALLANIKPARDAWDAEPDQSKEPPKEDS